MSQSDTKWAAIWFIVRKSVLVIIGKGRSFLHNNVSIVYFMTLHIHSQKQSAHWAVDVTAQLVPCWLSSWPVLRPLTWVYFPFIGLDITWVSCFRTVSPGDIQSREQKITWVSYIWTPESSINLISPPNWISTQRWLRWWYTVGWAISSESVQDESFLHTQYKKSWPDMYSRYANGVLYYAQ